MIDLVLISVFGGIGCALRVLARDVMQRRIACPSAWFRRRVTPRARADRGYLGRRA